MNKITIKDLLIEYFKKHPKQDLLHGPVVDWVEEKYKKFYNADELFQEGNVLTVTIQK